MWASHLTFLCLSYPICKIGINWESHTGQPDYPVSTPELRALCTIVIFVNRSLQCITHTRSFAKVPGGTPQLGAGGDARGTPVPHLRSFLFLPRSCPRQMVKTHDLPPDRNYLLISHPHGLMAHSAFGLFGTEGGDFSRTFPGLKPRLLTLNIFFWIPVLRDYLMSVGICSVCEDSIDYLLSRGKGTMVVVVVGGLAECHYSLPGCSTLVLRNRRGFVRKALQHGVALVPCYSFGENDLYGQRCLRAGSWERRLQDRLRALGHVYPCAFYGSGLSPGSRGLLPFHRTVTAVVGAPLPLPRIQAPSEETVAHYHGLYVAALRRLFDQHKADYGLPDTQELTVV
uniref:Acyltransferase n=1 Tax=Ornithorhynchus anatinus TaxID=9258 RepID=A0A6I8P841_ORNAN